MIKWLIGASLFILIRVGYGACTIEMVDLTNQIRTVTGSAVSSINLVDRYSKEPIKRYAQLLKDGSMLVLEQKNCSMYNFSLTLFLPENYPLKNAQNLMANILVITPIWKKWFHKLDAGKIFNSEFSSERFLSYKDKSLQFSYSMDDKIKTTENSSEVILSFVNLESYSTPYKNIISLYISVGGI